MALFLPLLATLFLTNAADVASAVIHAEHDFAFDLQGRIVYAEETTRSKRLSLEDATGCASVLADTSDPDIAACAIGNVVRLNGIGRVNEPNHVYAQCSGVRILSGERAVIAPIAADAAAIKSGRCDNRLVTVRGSLRDVFTDEIDHKWIFCVIDTRPDRLIGTLRTSSRTASQALARIKPLIGADISLTGHCRFSDLGSRRQIGRTICFSDPDALKADDQTIRNPFQSPLLDSIAASDPAEIARQGRRRVIGTVLAAWNGTRLLVRDSHGEIHKVELSDAADLACGNRIEAVGLPETDLYRINLSSAIFRRLPESDAPFEPACPTKGEPDAAGACALASVLFRGDPELRQFNPNVQGQLIRFRGMVSDRPGSTNLTAFTVRSDGVSIPVNVSGLRQPLPPVEIGCLAEVTGVCVVETETWRPYAPFPHTTGIAVVPRQAADIRIVARPPWWTTGRLLAVIGALLAVLLGLAVRNRILNRLREQVAKMRSELRVDERTRLAVELHDSIAQSLTAISFEIDTASRLADTDLPGMRKHLTVAANSLRSCRGELRNSLWDLRHQALEADSMEDAIRQTLAPHVAGVSLDVSFAVPRERISDSSAHAILRIVRELAVNAVRHGNATAIGVNGCLADGTLAFSVRDNGSGFDPASCPGDEQGHYGLLGVRERVNALEGSMTIDSAPGRGTDVTISLDTTRESQA